MIGYNRKHKALIRKATICCQSLNGKVFVKESNIPGDIYIMNGDSVMLTFSHLPSSDGDIILVYAGKVTASKKDFFAGCILGDVTGSYEWNSVLRIQHEDVESLINWTWNKLRSE